MGARSSQGIGHDVPQERKLIRIDQAYKDRDQNPKAFEQRLGFITDRQALVPHRTEQDFEVKTPVAVAGVRGKKVRGIHVVDVTREEAEGAKSGE